MPLVSLPGGREGQLLALETLNSWSFASFVVRTLWWPGGSGGGYHHLSQLCSVKSFPFSIDSSPSRAPQSRY